MRNVEEEGVTRMEKVATSYGHGQKRGGREMNKERGPNRPMRGRIKEKQETGMSLF